MLSCRYFILASVKCTTQISPLLNYVGVSYGHAKEFCEIKNRYSNHLKIQHQKSEHLTFQTLFWSSFHMIWRTFRISHILDHNTDLFVRFLNSHSKSRPHGNQADLDHLNTRLVELSNGYCISFYIS